MNLYIDTPIIDISVNPFIIDISLLLLFGLQHSLMARSFFKDGLLADVSDAVIYATYSVASSICLLLIYYFWQPIDGHLWNFENYTTGWFILSAVYAFGWIIAFLATFMIENFALIGLYQGYRILKNLPEPKPKFQDKLFYRYIRHPIHAGTIIGLWATPSMSNTHLLLSIGMTLYIFIGLRFEEKDLIKTFGERYKNYIDSTPMLIPFTKK
jgi:protein-S-isoprenylcysteine O-methyltransferase Ste14